ncbi:MAG TPA: DedA family protein [Intrasporangium sp.]|uniref:DedA family protein n=1 Tax=Intrasporangium sp. TaxID=1925024 RepID=UPI002D78CA2F|nr:DedA family protein [Intrasporangium sp.]HET7397016.1 DedA family protein [Intrasporangium sp.]
MSGLLDSILGAPAWMVLGVVGLVVFAEDALFVGFVIPGETVAILGGVAAHRGHVSFAAVLAVVVAAAIVGDSVGYEVGKHAGPRLLTWRALDKHRARLDDAQDLLARRGGAAVFLGRWVAFFRAVMPALAGTARMPYPRFLAFNAAGGVVWGAVVVTAGYLAGASYAQVEKTLGRDGAFVALAVAVVALVVWRVRKHRAERQVERRAGRRGGPQADVSAPE